MKKTDSASDSWGLCFVKCLKCGDLVCWFTNGEEVPCRCNAIRVKGGVTSTDSDFNPPPEIFGDPHDYQVIHWTEDCS